MNEHLWEWVCVFCVGRSVVGFECVSLGVCLFLFLFVCVCDLCVSAGGCESVSVGACLSVCLCVSMFVCVCACLFVCVFVCVGGWV